MGMFSGKISKRKGTKYLNNDDRTPQEFLDKAITMRDLEKENKELRAKLSKAVEALKSVKECHDSICTVCDHKVNIALKANEKGE